MTPNSICIVPEGASREVWMAERGEGCTASRAWTVARGGLSTWRREVELQMNGSTFRGNKFTSAGTSREAALLDEAAERDPSIRPNSALWGAVSNQLHRATPDGIGEDVVVEVKSHAHGWDSTDIPLEHMGQLQWQIHVLGVSHGLYGYEVRDEDDQPPVEGATWVFVPRDQVMIDWLIGRADAYIAWREDGCPPVMPMSKEIAAANATWVPLRIAADAAVALEKEAAAALKKAVESDPHGKRFGAVGMDEAGGFQITVATKNTLDEKAWAKAAPLLYDEVVAARELLKEARAEALAAIDENHAGTIEAIKLAEEFAATQYVKTTLTPTLRYQEATDV